MARMNVGSYAEVKALLRAEGFAESDLPLLGKNEDGASVILSAITDISDGSTAFKLETAQENGWMRINIFYKDGTVEELYER